MPSVTVYNNNVDKALRKLKKKTSEVMEEVKRRQHFEKPSTKRKKAQAAAKARWQKKLRNNQIN